MLIKMPYWPEYKNMFGKRLYLKVLSHSAFYDHRWREYLLLQTEILTLRVLHHELFVALIFLVEQVP